MIEIMCELGTIPVKQFTFNDGSVQVEIDGILPQSRMVVMAKLMSPDDQMALVMTVNAIRTSRPSAELALFLPFMPYGRQDSAFVDGQANAMKAWAGIINSLGFHTVVTVDPHSIAVNHIENLAVIDVCDILASSEELTELVKMSTLVSPDAGANKKAHKICKRFGLNELIRADKARNLETGEIIETVVYGDVSGKDCLIVDDICDGGMTFIKLAEALRKKGAKTVTLFVTHGIFSRTLGPFDGLIDEIYTTDSIIRNRYMHKTWEGHFEVINLGEIA